MRSSFGTVRMISERAISNVAWTMALEAQAQHPEDSSHSPTRRQRPGRGVMTSSLGGCAAAIGAAGSPEPEVVSTGGGVAPGTAAGGRGGSENDGGWASGADKR